VYVDNDPIVLLHAQVLLTSSPEGAVAYLDADLRDPEKILGEAAKTLDFGQPMAILLLGILHNIGDQDDPHSIVRKLVQAMPAGSYLAICHLTAGIYPELAEWAQALNERRIEAPMVLRDRAEVTSFFDGLELVEPGVVQLSKWRPRSEEESAAAAALWAGSPASPHSPMSKTIAVFGAGPGLGRQLDAFYYAPTPDTGFVPAASLTPQHAQNCMPLIFYTMLALVQEFLPHMLEQGDGAILTAQGGSTVQGLPDMSGPSPAQAAQRNYLQALHAEVADKGVYVGMLYIGAAIKNSAFHTEMEQAKAAGDPVWEMPTVDPEQLADVPLDDARHEGTAGSHLPVVRVM